MVFDKPSICLITKEAGMRVYFFSGNTHTLRKKTEHLGADKIVWKILLDSHSDDH
jgi:hypothetical protein